MKVLKSETVLKAYQAGIFPMADHRDDPTIFWLRPEIRGHFPMDQFHIPKSFKKMIRQSDYNITVNQDFRAVIKGCAKSYNSKRTGTWINHTIEQAFLELHALGYAHSFEARNASGELIGGLYGLAIQRVFFGESMFSVISGGSKFALVGCYIYLKRLNFMLFDTQFSNPHLKLFGCTDLPREVYEQKLKQALAYPQDFLQDMPRQFDLRQEIL